MNSALSYLDDEWSVTSPGERRRFDPYLPDSPLATFYRQMLDQGFDLTLVTDRSERVTYASQTAGAVMGCPPDRLLGRGLLSLVHPDDHSSMRSALAHTGDAPASLICRMRHDDAWRSVEAAVFVCLDPTGAPVRVVTLREVTPLAPQTTTAADGVAPRDAMQRVDAHDVIADISGMLKALVRRSVRIVYALDADVAWVGVDRVQLAQLLVNLAVNARDAMPRGGLITIATRNAPRLMWPAGTGSNAPGDWLTLEVADLGCGMTADVKARMFEPFFTTKARGQGIGLGLYTVMDIVRRAGGDIDVESSPGQGAIFRIHLPICAPPSFGFEARA